MTNTLYYGDNLDILRRYIADESVDLVYLDPPFNSNATYNVLFKRRVGEQAASADHRPSTTPGTGARAAEEAYHELVQQSRRQGGRHDRRPAQLLGDEPHDGLPGDDGAAAGGAAPRAEADRQHLPALRPDGEPLPEGDAGCGVWARELPERDHLEANERHSNAAVASILAQYTTSSCSTTKSTTSTWNPPYTDLMIEDYVDEVSIGIRSSRLADVYGLDESRAAPKSGTPEPDLRMERLHASEWLACTPENGWRSSIETAGLYPAKTGGRLS